MEDPPFIGDWHREKKLGSGGFGVVTLWRNRKTAECVAIKRCHMTTTAANDAANNVAKERWNREVEYMTNSVRHPNIVLGIRIKPDSFLVELNRRNPSPMPVLVMEYCEGGDLRRKLNSNRYTSGFQESEARDILKSLGAAIAYLHKLKITHRDIKPENIVFKKDSETGRMVYKLTDLGYAKPLGHQSVVASLVGTLEYIAPELCLTDRYTNSVDYWSLGVIAFEIVTGSRPFVPHLPLAQWMNTVKVKTSGDICITESPTGQFEYSKRLPAQHKFSSCLAELLEPWLQIALEWNPKHRGHIYKSAPVSSDAQSRDTLPPIPELKIFSMLDIILTKKILTVFSMHTYELLSYEINEATTMIALQDLIAKDTQLKASQIRFVLHIAHPSPLERLDDTTKPMEMYWPDQDLPMCYAYVIGESMRMPGPLKLSPVQTEVLIEPNGNYKPHIIKRFAFDTFYMHCREHQAYTNLVDGLHSLVLRLNHDVVLLCESKIDRMLRLAYNLEGAMSMIEHLPKTENELSCQAEPPADLVKLTANTKTVIAACEKINKRYRSVYRRSIEYVTTSNRVSVRSTKEDLFELTPLEKSFEILRVQLLQKVSTQKQHQEMVRSVDLCMKRRDNLLREPDMVHLSAIFIMAHEIEEIQKTLEMGIAQAQKYQEDVRRFLADPTNRTLSRSNGEYLPDIVGIGHETNGVDLIKPCTNIVAPTSKTVPQLVADRPIDIPVPVSQPITLIDFNQGEKAATLIQDNVQMHSAFESMINELNEELNLS